MNSSSRQLVYLIILSFSMHCFESQLRGREAVRYFTSVAARISELATTENKSSWRPLGLVARSLVSANCWLRGIKMYRFPWYLTLVSTNHASSNPGLVCRAVLDWLGASGLQVQRSNRSAKLPHPSLFQNYTWSTSYIWSDGQQLKGKWTNKQTNEQNEQIKAKWTLFNNWGLSVQLCQFKTFIS